MHGTVVVNEMKFEGVNVSPPWHARAPLVCMFVTAE